ncbi:hypothetical protein FBUS_11191, partial [Fasciolopsis buskii]
ALALHPSSPILTAAQSNCAIEFWSSIETSESVSTPTFAVHVDRVHKPVPSDTAPLSRPTCSRHLANRPDSSVSSQCLMGKSASWLFLMDIKTSQSVSQCPQSPRIGSPVAAEGVD